MKSTAAAANLDATPRRRLIDALADSIDDVGYSTTTVADIVRRARTSRRTFYEYFSDREACLVALLTETNRQAIETISAAVDPAAPWTVQIRQAVEAWIANAESRPAVMLSWIRDVPALGMAGDAAGSVLFVVYVVAALRATVGFDLLRSAVNGVLGVTVAIVALVGVVVGNGLDAAALGAYRPIARQVSSLSAKVDQAVAPFVAVPAPVVPATVSGVVAAAPHPAVGKGKGKGTGKASPTAGPTATAADPAADLGPADAAKAAKRAKHHKPAKEVQPANDVEAVTVLEDLATPTADGKGGHHKGRAALEIGTPITAFP